jgi:glucose-1-phosphate cytidylyltransferase
VGWINGGFMILDPKVIDYIEGDDTVFERGPLEALSAEGELMAFRHRCFWQCMDTMKDKEKLEGLLAKGRAPWKKWEE